MLYDRQVSATSFEDELNIVAQEGAAENDILTLVESRVGLGHWRVLPMGRLLTVSNCAGRILNLEGTASGHRLSAFVQCFVPKDGEIFAGLIEHSISRKRGFEAVLRLYCQGQIKLVEIFCDVVVDEGGALKELVGTLRDITKRAKQQAMSQGRAAMMRVLMHNIPSAIAVLDKNMTYLSASDHWAAGHGLNSVEELLGNSHYDLFPAAVAFKPEHKKVLAGEILRSKRAFLKDSQGKPIEQLCVMCPWKTSQHVIGGMIIMLGTVDIKKTLKFADAEAEEQSATLLELLEQVD